jgi:hypothetical protein
LIAPDTSVLIPALAPDYEGHVQCLDAVAGRSPRLISHVGFETTSVLSRVPEGLRIASETVRDALDQDFPIRGSRLTPTLNAPVWTARSMPVCAAVRSTTL